MTDDAFVFEEAFNVICGERLGGGISREVFACTFDRSLVVKVEREAHSYQNISEYQFWQDNVDHAPVRRWLAPCVAISPRGSVLLQRRAEPVQRDQLPKKLPRFLTDIKSVNFGILDGRLVCCDYGYTHYRVSARKRRVEWRD